MTGVTSGREQSVDQIYDRVRLRIRRVLASYEIPTEDAEDVLQESLLALMLRWKDTHSPEDYLLGILRYKCAAYIRQRYEERHVVRLDQAALEAIAGGSPPVQEALARTFDIATICERLSVQQSCVIVLRWMGFTHREIGKVCGRETATVRQDAARAIDRLQVGLAMKRFRRPGSSAVEV